MKNLLLFIIFSNDYISASMPKSNRPEVRIADQIAIRSFVLGQSLGKIGNFQNSIQKIENNFKNVVTGRKTYYFFLFLFLGGAKTEEK